MADASLASQAPHVSLAPASTGQADASSPSSAPQSGQVPTAPGTGPSAAPTDTTGEPSESGQHWHVTVFNQTYTVTEDGVRTQLSRLAGEMVQFAQQRQADEQDYVNNDRIPILSTLADWAGGAKLPDPSAWDEVVGSAESAQAAAASGDFDSAVADLNAAGAKYQTASTAWSDYLSKSAQGGETVEKDAANVGIGIVAVGIATVTGGTGLVALAAIGAGDGALSNAVDQWIDMSNGNQQSFNFASMTRATVVDAIVWAVSGAVSNQLSDAITSKCVGWFTDINPELLAKVNECLTSNGAEAIDGVELMNWIPANLTRALRALPGTVVSAAAQQVLNALSTWTMDAVVEGFPSALWQSSASDIVQLISENLH